MKYIKICKKFSTALLLGALLTGCGGSSSGGDNQSSSSKNGNGSGLSTDGTSLVSGQQSSSNSVNGNQNDKDKSDMGSFQTKAPAKDVTSSDSAMFIAEGDHGVEVVKIGYNDRIDYDLVSTITGINASRVFLSDDQTTLYVENKEGYINVIDIQDVKHPRKVKLLTKDALQSDTTTANGVYEFKPAKENGLIVYDISNPSHKERVATYKEHPVYDLVLVDRDTKALVATKTEGIALLDISDPQHITFKNSYPLEGETTGLSVNKLSGLLFVANGDRGVKVFNLNIFLDELR